MCSLVQQEKKVKAKNKRQKCLYKPASICLSNSLKTYAFSLKLHGNLIHGQQIHIHEQHKQNL